VSELVLLSWNVNGARSIHRRGFLSWLESAAPDVLCLQETRAVAEQLEPQLAAPLGYHALWNGARSKPGYSGTAILSRRRPQHVEYGLGDAEFDAEGRTLLADFGDFVLLNGYFPNGRRDHSRVPFKLRYCERFLTRCEALRRAGKAIVFCGDLNTSHREIDLARPRENQNTTGFLPQERAFIDRLLANGYVDTFRNLHPAQEGAYTWWSTPMRARERNIGWRLDYFFVAEELRPAIAGASIHADVLGSDHCPVELRLSF
jgi:exodeoxyribonuclease-3